MDVLEQLELFRARADELADMRLVRNGLSPSISLNFHHLRGLSFTSREPDEEDLRSFLLTFRQFLSNDEPVFLYRIYNLCHRHLSSDELKGCLIRSREARKLAHRDSGLSLVYNERELTPEFVTDLWINGYYFHSDAEKRRLLGQLLPHERLLVRFWFLNFLVEATRQVLYGRNIVTIALEAGLRSADARTSEASHTVRMQHSSLSGPELH